LSRGSFTLAAGKGISAAARAAGVHRGSFPNHVAEGVNVAAHQNSGLVRPVDCRDKAQKAQKAQKKVPVMTASRLAAVEKARHFSDANTGTSDEVYGDSNAFLHFVTGYPHNRLRRLESRRHSRNLLSPIHDPWK
jgi:hypothetical protein